MFLLDVMKFIQKYCFQKIISGSLWQYFFFFWGGGGGEDVCFNKLAEGLSGRSMGQYFIGRYLKK